MQITYTLCPAGELKNIYMVEISTYYGDGDGDGNCAFSVEANNIKQVIAELLIVENQFPSGRGGCRSMYDQTNYFSMSHEAYEANNDAHDGYFEWFDRETSDFPYNSDYEQNHTIDSYEIWFYDAAGARYATHASDYDDLIADIVVLNDKHHLGDYDYWENVRYPHNATKKQMAKYEEARQALEDRFAAYRVDAIELVKKYQ